MTYDPNCPDPNIRDSGMMVMDLAFHLRNYYYVRFVIMQDQYTSSYEIRSKSVSVSKLYINSFGSFYNVVIGDDVPSYTIPLPIVGVCPVNPFCPII